MFRDFYTAFMGLQQLRLLRDPCRERKWACHPYEETSRQISAERRCVTGGLIMLSRAEIYT